MEPIKNTSWLKAAELAKQLEFRKAIAVYEVILKEAMSDIDCWKAKLKIANLYLLISVKEYPIQVIEELKNIPLPPLLEIEYLCIQYELITHFKGLVKESIPIAEKALELAEKHEIKDFNLHCKLFYNYHLSLSPISYASMQEQYIKFQNQFEQIQKKKNPEYNRMQLKFLFALMRCAHFLGEVNSLKDYFSQAKTLSKETPYVEDILVRVYYQFSFLAQGMSFYHCIECLKKSIEYHKIAYKEDFENQKDYGPLFIDMGRLIRLTGDVYTGIQYIKKGLHNAIKLDSLLQGRGYLCLAQVYQDVGRYKEAVELGELVLEREKKEAKNPVNILNVTTELTSLYKDYDVSKAIDLYRAVIPKLEEQTQGLRYQLSLANCYSGMIELAQGDEKIFYLQKCLGLTSFLQSQPLELARNYVGIGQGFLDIDIKKAETYYIKAIDLLLLDQSFSLDKKNDWTNKNLNPNTSWSAINGVAKCFLKRFEKEGEQIYLERALVLYESSLELLDFILNNFKTEGSKLTFNEKVIESLACAIKATLLANQSDQKARVFEFIENGKAKVLLSNLNESNAKGMIEDPDFVQQLESLEGELLALDTRMANAKVEQDENANPLFNLYFEKILNYQELKKEIEDRYPKYKKLKNQNSIVDLEEIQDNLAEDQKLLNYFLYQQTLYAVVIEKFDSNIIEIELPETFESKVEDYIRAINFLESKKVNELGFELYQLLIQPCYDLLFDIFGAAEVQELIIIPHSYLARIPFDTLLQKEKIEGEAAAYLVDSFDISYHYSASLWCNQNRKKIDQKCKYSFMGFAPVYLEEVQASTKKNRFKQEATREKDKFSLSFTEEKLEFDPLPYSKEEVLETAQLFQDKNKKAHKFIHKDASKSALQNNASQAEILHLAAHFHQNENPKLSGIVMANEELLYIQEAFKLDLNAKLVVLSACQSAIGQLYNSEGMIAMNRGLLNSGAQNIISTLFKVSDKVSSQLMKHFYINYLEGQSINRALGNAKRSILNEHPHFPIKYWSAFVLMGN